ncbi:MAG TPA: L-threonylcarbamoyladenylate synthase [Candidatus Limnocylindrales bacterium]|nr:L-threonylcarbamoyladenylate synthase [Candidatus Limnocylindrales bacterium]
MLPASADALEAAATLIRAAHVVAVPTETVYGLASSLDEAGVAALLAAKARSPQKGITLLVDALEQVTSRAELPKAAHLLADRFWPGPLTLVLPERPAAGLPATLTGGRGTVGFRLPDHEVPRALARRLGPLPLTSANRSGEPDATSAAEVVAALGGEIALVIDGGAARGGVPSTVVLVAADGEWRTLRQGALDEAALRTALGQ